MELIPDAGVGAIAQPPPAGHPRAVAQLLSEPVPADAGGQDDQDVVEAGAVVKRESAEASAGGGGTAGVVA
jgi:hypothetical protein